MRRQVTHGYCRDTLMVMPTIRGCRAFCPTARAPVSSSLPRVRGATESVDEVGRGSNGVMRDQETRALA
jgi:hypothetical protein